MIATHHRISFLCRTQKLLLSIESLKIPSAEIATSKTSLLRSTTTTTSTSTAAAATIFKISHCFLMVIKDNADVQRLTFLTFSGGLDQSSSSQNLCTQLRPILVDPGSIINWGRSIIFVLHLKSSAGIGKKSPIRLFCRFLIRKNFREKFVSTFILAPRFLLEWHFPELRVDDNGAPSAAVLVPKVLVGKMHLDQELHCFRAATVAH